jgi:hypothetical protein
MAMKIKCRSILYKLPAFLLILQICSCKKLEEYNQKPELESLQQGIKITAALGYCASVVMSVIEGDELPDNVIFEKNTGLIYISIDKNHPLPFNKNIGDIIIAFTWSGRAGLMSVLFAKIDLLGGNTKLYGLHLMPFMKRSEEEGIYAMFEKQDIIVGNGSDTLLDMTNITDVVFNTKVNQLNSEEPNDAFVAVKQNVWFINIDQKNTYSNVYDDNITVNGGGQIVEAKGAAGGIMYHAMIGTKINYSICNMNPVSGFALTQNFKFGGEPYIDLGNSLLSFHNTCDGKAFVDVSTGKYLGYIHKYLTLNLN